MVERDISLIRPGLECVRTSVGVGPPGDRVMVQAPKSVEMVALYLAVLKTGAVFVPLVDC